MVDTLRRAKPCHHPPWHKRGQYRKFENPLQRSEQFNFFPADTVSLSLTPVPTHFLRDSLFLSLPDVHRRRRSPNLSDRRRPRIRHRHRRQHPRPHLHHHARLLRMRSRQSLRHSPPESTSDDDHDHHHFVGAGRSGNGPGRVGHRFVPEDSGRRESETS